MKTVELHSAFMFTCDECGLDTFVRRVSTELSREDQTGVARTLGYIGEFEDLPPNTGVNVGGAPKTVRCGYCKTEFEVSIPCTESDE